MIIKPKFRGFICTAAHPEGCYNSVKEWIDYIKKQEKVDGPKRVLVIGASTGYGLASRITASYSCGAKTIGVFLEKSASDSKTATPGWYNTAAFEKIAAEDGIYAKSINGDAFSNEIKAQTIELIKKDFGEVDLVVYSLASPRRTDPSNGVTYSSVIKPIAGNFVGKTVDFHTGVITEANIAPASEEEVAGSIKVMGGEDWELWINELKNAGVLAKGAITIAYSYIGPTITYPVYREGTIGRAKDHLEKTAKKLNNIMSEIDGKSYVSVCKALVTQASSAIPVVPLYISIMDKVHKEKGLFEGCIEQIYRLFDDRLYSGDPKLDEKGRIRIDDWEMREDVQKEIADIWDIICSENINDLSDIQGYRDEFFKLFGFGYSNVDYDKDVNPEVAIPSIIE